MVQSSGAATAVVLTALDLEYDAVRSRLERPERRWHPAGTHYEIGDLRGRSHWRVAIAEIGEGNVGSATATERAISFFHPRVVLFVGIAGSLKNDIHLGDVVVATKVYGIHGGRAEDELLVRPVSFAASYRLEQTARHVRRQSWHDDACSCATDTAPHVHAKPIAAGEILLDSSQSSYRELIRNSYNDAAAIEMEGVGFLEAAHANNDVPALVLRGISDAASKKGTADQGGWQRVAATHAAAFAVELLRDLDPSDFPARSAGHAGPTTTVPTSQPASVSEATSPPLRFMTLREFRLDLALERVAGGEIVALTSRGAPVAFLVPFEAADPDFRTLRTSIVHAEDDLRLGIARPIDSALGDTLGGDR